MASSFRRAPHANFLQHMRKETQLHQPSPRLSWPGLDFKKIQSKLSLPETLAQTKKASKTLKTTPLRPISLLHPNRSKKKNSFLTTFSATPLFETGQFSSKRPSVRNAKKTFPPETLARIRNAPKARKPSPPKPSPKPRKPPKPKP